MTATHVFKYLLRALFWLASRHRMIGLRDWLASIFSILISAVVLAVPYVVEIVAQLKTWNFAGVTIPVLKIIVIAVVCWIPLSFILKLRRLGITDADYSVSSGIDYAAALESAKNGFSFSGVSASKLKDRENELRDAMKRTAQHRGEIRMLLLEPESEAIAELEKVDGTTGYRIKARGTLEFLQQMGQQYGDQIKVRSYQATSVQEMKPFRLFLTDEDCLVSPFMQGTGERDQGRGLPQLRITSRSFPRGNDPTLYTAFSNYFELNWREGSTS